MSQERNIAAQQRFAEIVNSGQLGRLGEAIAPDVVDHDPAPSQGPGPAGFQATFAAMAASFPDLRVAADAVVADEENVAIAYQLTGTHQGEFLGLAPTGRTIQVRGVQIGRFRDGLLVERWGSSDQLGILQQLGAQVRP